MLIPGTGLSPREISEEGEEAPLEPAGLPNLTVSLGVKNAQVFPSGRPFVM